MKKLAVILLLLTGESIAIYSEMIAARDVENFTPTFWKMFGVITIAGFPLILGYMLGVKYLHNIWAVGAISIASIVVAEPIITYFIFHTLPTRGPLIGLVLGILAICATLFIK
jgi:hypothetical protein